jgi:hypothetical protein
MQFSISDTAAIRFADDFYRSLPDGGSIDAASCPSKPGRLVGRWPPHRGAVPAQYHDLPRKVAS